MIHLKRPLTVELTDLINRLGYHVLHDDGFSAEEVRDLREFLQACRAKMHEELRAARISAMSIRQGANVVPLDTVRRVDVSDFMNLDDKGSVA